MSSVLVNGGQQTFQKNLAFGQVAESAIARWLIRHGYMVLPIYDIEYETGKGPRLFLQGKQLVAPDLLVWSAFRKGRELTWIEAKHKTRFTWYRKKERWVTGIDLHHYRNYLQVADVVGRPVWLLFLHECGTPSAEDLGYRCPSSCPVGLFGGPLRTQRDTNGDVLHPGLEDCISHKSDKWGSSGMVYWAEQSLRFRVPLEEVMDNHANDQDPGQEGHNS